MKKPKFNQLRGTHAHSLRHRICLGISVATLVLGVICNFGVTALVPKPAAFIKPHIDKILAYKRKTKDWLVFIEPVNGPEL